MWSKNKVIIKQKENTTTDVGMKLPYVFSLLMIVIALLILSLYIYWIVEPTNVLVIKNNPIPVEKRIVQSGDVQIADISYCKNRNVTGYVTWQLVSDKIVALPPYAERQPIGCNSHLRTAIVLPAIAYTGKYSIQWIVHYNVNPLKSSVTQFNTRSFTIVGKEDN